MAIVTRVNGSAGLVGGGLDGGLAPTGASVKFYVIDAGGDLSNQDGVGQALEALFRVLPSGVIAYSASGSSGVVSVIVDGHAAPDEDTLELAIRALGSVNGYSFAGATVTTGTSFTVA